MNTIKMSAETNYDRRRFLGLAAMGIAAVEFGVIGSANAQSGSTITTKLGANTSFASLKKIDGY